MVTLTILDKESLDDEVFLKMLDAYSNSSKKKNNKEGDKLSNKVAANSRIYAVPITKKLPWMSISNIPQEFINDI